MTTWIPNGSSGDDTDVVQRYLARLGGANAEHDWEALSAIAEALVDFIHTRGNFDPDLDPEWQGYDD